MPLVYHLVPIVKRRRRKGGDKKAIKDDKKRNRPSGPNVIAPPQIKSRHSRERARHHQHGKIIPKNVGSHY